MKIYKPDKIKYLKLEEHSWGDVDLVACNAEGGRKVAGFLFTFKDNGLLKIHTHVDKDLGLKLNERGQIEEKEDEQDK